MRQRKSKLLQAPKAGINKHPKKAPCTSLPARPCTLRVLQAPRTRACRCATLCETPRSSVQHSVASARAARRSPGTPAQPPGAQHSLRELPHVSRVCRVKRRASEARASCHATRSHARTHVLAKGCPSWHAYSPYSVIVRSSLFVGRRKLHSV
eukprot:6181080-Pleurochrysis_carterae.AAC.5